jgi:hypothetical protein
MLLDLGALVLEMHRHGRFLPDSLQRRAAEAVGTDAEVRSLSRTLDAGDGMPDLVAAGIAGNCERCGALHTTGAAFCSQCGNELEPAALPRKAALGLDPQLAGAAPVPRRPVAAAAPAGGLAAHSDEPSRGETQVLDVPGEEPPSEEPPDTPDEPANGEEPEGEDGAPALPPLPATRRARATRVRQRLDEPARRSEPLPTGLIAGIVAGVIVIVLGALILSSGGGGDDEPERQAQAPGQREPEPPPPDEAETPADETPSGPDAALEPVEVTADDYDPSGDSQEHGEETALAVDGDAATSWPTEEYDTGSLQKDGVGLTLQPAEAVPARGLDLQTTTPGFDMTIYGAETSLPTSIDSGWTQIASEQDVERKGRIDLDSAGSDFSYYLIWITKIPEDSPKVEISEARLLR